MDPTLLAGYAAMMALGVLLGLIGAGGSILTVPILVYLLGVAPGKATGYSLAIVGATALAGAVQYVRRGQMDLRIALVFGPPAILAVLLARTRLLPAIPDPVVALSGAQLGKDTAIMLFFAVLMVATSFSMIRTGHEERASTDVRPNKPILAVLGFGVGTITGIVGAGGGFMILPVLVLLGGLPMRVAIGTDLLIIAAKSLIGFLGEARVADSIDYHFVGTIVLLPLVGIIVGTRLNLVVPAARLKSAFGWFVLAMGAYTVLRETVWNGSTG